MPDPVVVAATVLAGAIASQGDSTATFTSWPSAPFGDRYAGVLDIVNDGVEFSLWLSPRIVVETTALVLSQGRTRADVETYIVLLNQIAKASGGGIAAPQTDESPVDLARHVNARLVVTDDPSVLSLTSIDGIVPLDPAGFIAKVEAIRREARRQRFELRQRNAT